jgi:hypothetical protein
MVDFCPRSLALNRFDRATDAALLDPTDPFSPGSQRSFPFSLPGEARAHLPQEEEEMEDITLSAPSGVNPGVVHHLPCRIAHDGPAKVSTYFPVEEEDGACMHAGLAPGADSLSSENGGKRGA